MLVPCPPRRSLWRQEANHLARSGLTLAFNQLLQIAIPFITTSMTGRLGVEALAGRSSRAASALATMQRRPAPSAAALP
jgi:hypothetical protein